MNPLSTPHHINIPALYPCVRSDGSLPPYASQPIFCFKELEVDRVRYDAWKAACARPRAARGEAR